MTEGDQLLEWLSFRQSGTRKDLPQAQLSRRQPALVLWRLAVLAHVEIQSQGRWSIVPPTLAGLADGGHEYSAVLCGARTPGVIEKLRKAATARGARIDETALDHQPSRICVSALQVGEIERLADEADLAYQADAGFTLLAALPSIAQWPRESMPPVSGKAGKVKRFSRRQLSWVDSSLGEAGESPKGLFHIHRDWDAVTVLKSGRDGHFSIDTAAGRLAVARKLKAARFNVASGRFELPTALMPPMMMTRALALASGFMPGRDRSSGFSQFAGVPARSAWLALGLMELRLQ
jgi:hypothetical protein